MPKMDHFLSKHVYMYNDVLCINGSKVAALNVYYHFNVCTSLKSFLIIRPQYLTGNPNEYLFTNLTWHMFHMVYIRWWFIYMWWKQRFMGWKMKTKKLNEGLKVCQKICWSHDIESFQIHFYQFPCTSIVSPCH